MIFLKEKGEQNFEQKILKTFKQIYFAIF